MYKKLLFNIISYLELNKTAWQRPATTRRPRSTEATESWMPRRYLNGEKKKLLEPGGRKLSEITHVLPHGHQLIDWLTDWLTCLPHALQKVPKGTKKYLKRTHVFATCTPRSKAVPKTRSIWFHRLRSQSRDDLFVWNILISEYFDILSTTNFF